MKPVQTDSAGQSDCDQIEQVPITVAEFAASVQHAENFATRLELQCQTNQPSTAAALTGEASGSVSGYKAKKKKKKLKIK